jgi:hypothetical protein
MRSRECIIVPTGHLRYTDRPPRERWMQTRKRNLGRRGCASDSPERCKHYSVILEENEVAGGLAAASKVDERHPTDKFVVAPSLAEGITQHRCSSVTFSVNQIFEGPLSLRIEASLPCTNNITATMLRLRQTDMPQGGLIRQITHHLRCLTGEQNGGLNVR